MVKVAFKASTLLGALHVGGFLSKMETCRVSIERPDKVLTIGESETTVADLLGDDWEDPFEGHQVGDDLADAITYIKTGQPHLASAMLGRIFGPEAMVRAEAALRA